MPTKPTYKRPGYLPKKSRSSARPNLAYYLSAWWQHQKAAFYAIPENQYCKGIKGNGQPCLKPRAKYFQVDHIKPLPQDITFEQFMELSELWMLQALCGGCHVRKTLKERRS